MGSDRPNPVLRRRWNGVAAWGKFLLAFALGIGVSVAATFKTFETQAAHERDVVRQEESVRDVRESVKEVRQLIIELDMRNHSRYLQLQERLDKIMDKGFYLPSPSQERDAS